MTYRAAIGIAVVLAMAWFFRYEVTPVNQAGAYIRLDKWTGKTQTCWTNEKCH